MVDELDVDVLCVVEVIVVVVDSLSPVVVVVVVELDVVVVVAAASSVPSTTLKLSNCATAVGLLSHCADLRLTVTLPEPIASPTPLSKPVHLALLSL